MPTTVASQPVLPADTSYQNRVRETPSNAVPPRTTSTRANSDGLRSSATVPTSGTRNTSRPFGPRPTGESRPIRANSTPKPSALRATFLPQRQAIPTTASVYTRPAQPRTRGCVPSWYTSSNHKKAATGTRDAHPLARNFGAMGRRAGPVRSARRANTSQGLIDAQNGPTRTTRRGTATQKATYTATGARFATTSSLPTNPAVTTTTNSTITAHRSTNAIPRSVRIAESATGRPAARDRSRGRRQSSPSAAKDRIRATAADQPACIADTGRSVLPPTPWARTVMEAKEAVVVKTPATRRPGVHCRASRLRIRPGWLQPFGGSPGRLDGRP